VFADGTLAGQVALVTGGGTNLGKAAAAELARCGASVVIAGRRKEVLETAADELGPSISWVTGDIRTREGSETIVRSALDRHGRLDFLLNNAGGQYFVAAESIAVKGWRAVQRLNVGGTLAMSEAAHRVAMQPAKAGKIVNVTVSPHQGFPAMAHTGAARAAVEAFTRELAADWAPDGIGRSHRARSFRDGVSSKVPSRALAKGGRVGAAPSPRDARGVRVARRVAGVAARHRVLGSIVTLDGALDNWPGRWPPPDLARDGGVPTEERRSAA